MDLVNASRSQLMMAADTARDQRLMNEIRRRGQVADGGGQNSAEITKAAKDFEAMMMGQMVEKMFTDIDPNGPFGGGRGEEIFRSFLTQEYGKQIAETGQTGIADQISRNLLNIQEQRTLKEADRP